MSAWCRRALRDHGWWAAIVLSAFVVGAAGSATLPLDDHEVYVVQTAQEMRERHDWIVPHFLGKPRLNKPPLSYWVVGALAEAAASPRVTPWQGRLPSVLGGVGVVALTMLIGLLLADRTVAAMAGLIAASSLGFFRYTHSARPDMLYAFWCTAMLAAFVWGRRPGASRPGAGAGLVWIAAALATLTKGPQVPAMFLVAAVLVEVDGGTSLRELRRTLRPLAGMSIVLVLTVPWWWALDRALGGQGLRGTQLDGSLLVLSWRHLLDPYYFYRPLALVLPSAAILVAAFGCRRWPSLSEHRTRLLAVFVVLPALAFSLGTQHRPHYMLPVLAPMCVLLALVTRAVVAPTVVPSSPSRLPRALLAFWALALAVETGLGWTLSGWSKERIVAAELGALAGRALPATTPLFAFRVGSAAPSYYAGRPIRAVRSLERVVAALAAAPGGTLGLLTERRALEPLRDGVDATILGRGLTGAGEEMLLVELKSRARSPRGAPEKRV